MSLIDILCDFAMPKPKRCVCDQLPSGLFEIFDISDCWRLHGQTHRRQVPWRWQYGVPIQDIHGNPVYGESGRMVYTGDIASLDEIRRQRQHCTIKFM